MTWISEELRLFLEGGQAMVVATRSASLAPTATRACGLKVLGGDRVRILLPRATSERARKDLNDNGQIAVTVSSPRDLATYQLKGRCLCVSEGTPEDLLLAEEQLRLFGEHIIATFGMTRSQARNLWLFDNLRVDMRVDAVFLQTPGPGAGALIQRRDG